MTVWRGVVEEAFSDGRVWVIIPDRAGDTPVGPLHAVPAGLVRGEGVLVTATDARGRELLVVSRLSDGQAQGAGSWDELTGKPTVFPPAAHTHGWDQVTGKPATYPPAAHVHPASQVSDSTVVGRGVLTATDAGAARTVIGAGTSNLALGSTSTTARPGNWVPSWSEVTSKPAAFPPSVHSHVWADITDRPTSLPPGPHTHPAAEVSDATTVGRSVLTASTAAAARTAIGAGTSNLALGSTSVTAKAGNWVPSWAEVTGKPATFAPSAHGHLWADITDPPASFPPGPHTHLVADITDLPAITSAPTPSTLAARAANGRIQAADPAAAADVATKGYVDGVVTGAYTVATLTNGWARYQAAFAPPRYRLEGGTVRLAGALAGSTSTAVAFTLPPALCPAWPQLLSGTISTTQPAQWRINVSTSGAVSFTGITANPGWISLDGVTFSLD